MRLAFEWFEQMAATAASGGVCGPVVLDADDLIADRGVVGRLATLLGGDPEELVFEWEAVEGRILEELGSVAWVYESTLLASRGIDEGKGRAGEVDVEVEWKGWVEEFGVEVAGGLRRFVEAALPDYEYLKGKRLRC